MSEKLTPKLTPYTAAELVECGWVSRVRSAILKDGNEVCVGGDCTIKANTPGRPTDYQDIMLPNGDLQLTDMEQCLRVIDMLKGRTPIPEPKAKV